MDVTSHNLGLVYIRCILDSSKLATTEITKINRDKSRSYVLVCTPDRVIEAQPMNDKELKLTFHIDPGHGWLEVPVNLLTELGIINHISPYSYYRKKPSTAYLEEDVDVYTFTKAAKAAGWTINVVEKYVENTPIRKHSRYPSHKDWAVMSGWEAAA